VTGRLFVVSGPSGVGKELYAKLIHERSPRARRAFVPVNCGALPPDLFENELFGHVEGAFTGARTRAAGLVSEAEGGTLFLDEVDSLPLASQVKLLRLIQEKEFRPLGQPQLRTCDVRFIAATNSDLLAEVQAGRFRPDLFFRLRVVPLDVPPLRDRPEDVLVLLNHFIAYYSVEYGQPPVSLTDRANARLVSYSWPGNMRELENCARCLICTRGGRVVDADDLPLIDFPAPQEADPGPEGEVWDEQFQVAKRRLVRTFERDYVERSLRRHAGNISAAARASGKNRRAFFELMRRHGLTRAR